jgi:murein DD-endopeptidase MepM/ murein hydrolase activator NlpD
MSTQTRLLTVVGLVLSAACAVGAWVAQTAHAQSASGTAPTMCGNTPCASSQSDTVRERLEDITIAAKNVVPTFIRTVQDPLGPYFNNIAFLLAYGTAFIFIMRMMRQGGDAQELYWGLARLAVCFSLLGYCAYRAHDHPQGDDLPSNIAKFGTYFAHGEGGDDHSFLGRAVLRRQLLFSNGYSDFVSKTFFYQIDGDSRLVEYPDEGANGTQTLAVPSTGGEVLQKVATALTSQTGWSMEWLFSFLNLGRGVVEFGDLFLLMLGGFLLAAIKLSAQFVVGISIDREFAQRIGKNFAWGTFISLVALPIVSQIIRLMAYSVAAIPFGRVGSPYFVYDATTGNVVVHGDPFWMILISGLLMLICGLCLFASPLISYKLAQGGVFEAISSTVSGWMGAITGVGLSMWSAATAAAWNRQAAELTAGAQARGDSATAEGAYRTELIGANAKHSADMTRSRAEAMSASSSAELEAWGASQRADISMQEKMAGYGASAYETLINNEGKRRAEDFGAIVGLDKTSFENWGIFGSIGQEARDGWKHVTGSGQPASYSDYMNNGPGGSDFTPQFVAPGNSPGWAAPVPNGGTFNSPRDGGHRMHHATDQSAPAGTPIGVAADGTVSANGWDDEAGWYVKVDHGNGWQTSYSHLQQQSSLLEGAQISRGEMLGRVGNTGSGSHGNHLHFVTRHDGARVDANQTNMRPFLGNSVGNPGGVAVSIPQGNQAIRNAPFPVQDKLMPREKTHIETGAGDAAARVGYSIRSGAAQTEAAALRGVASQEARSKTAIAYTAHGERMKASDTELHASQQSAQIRHDASRFAIDTRLEAAMKAANLQYLSTLVNSFGSSAASQLQSALQQYNRF